MNRKETISKDISIQLNRMLVAKAGQSEIIDHNLEKGLGNEQAFRDMLTVFLPLKYGVAKGKVVNSEGRMSKHLDVIIYDALQCPKLFIDKNENIIVPIEGVYKVVEIKTTLDNNSLIKAFANLQSVYELKKREDYSTNDFVTCCPPFLEVFAFNDKRRLGTIANQFITLSKKYKVDKSSISYTPKSPGYAEHTGKQYLILDIHVLDKGCVSQMLGGSVCIHNFGEYTFGMFLTEFLSQFDEMKLPEINIRDYLNWIMVDKWCNDNNQIPSRKILK